MNSVRGRVTPLAWLAHIAYTQHSRAKMRPGWILFSFAAGFLLAVALMLVGVKFLLALRGG